MSEIRPEQCRAARAFLNWKQDDLAAFTKLSSQTIRSFEGGGPMRASNQHLLMLVFTSAGITFDEDERGRMRVTFNPEMKARFLASQTAN